MFGKTYEVVKFTQRGTRPRVQYRNLTLAEAQKKCKDPETSSRTARAPRGCLNSKGFINEAKVQRWHNLGKHWFYGYREER
jgi:hypothetical protein